MRKKIDYKMLYDFIKERQPVCYMTDIHDFTRTNFGNISYAGTYKAIDKLVRDGLLIKKNRMLTIKPQNDNNLG